MWQKSYIAKQSWAVIRIVSRAVAIGVAGMLVTMIVLVMVGVEVVDWLNDHRKNHDKSDRVD